MTIYEALDKWKNSIFYKDIINHMNPIAIIVSGSNALGYSDSNSDIDLLVISKHEVDYLGENNFFYRVGDIKITLYVESISELFDNHEKRTGVFALINPKPENILYVDDKYSLDITHNISVELTKYSLWLYFSGLNNKITNLIEAKEFNHKNTTKKYYIISALYNILSDNKISDESIYKIKRNDPEILKELINILIDIKNNYCYNYTDDDIQTLINNFRNYISNKK